MSDDQFYQGLRELVYLQLQGRPNMTNKSRRRRAFVAVESLKAALDGSGDSRAVKGDEMRSKPVRDLRWSARAHNCIEQLGAETLGDLAECTPDDLLYCKNVGTTTVTEIQGKLMEHGLRLRGDW
jgi:DNA-directed RNA polymerase alpha subunit